MQGTALWAGQASGIITLSGRIAVWSVADHIGLSVLMQRVRIGIHVSGNFERGNPTTQQIEALAMLIATICHDYQLPIDSEHVVGHRDLMATACPGANLYKELQTIRGKAIWYQQN